MEKVKLTQEQASDLEKVKYRVGNEENIVRMHIDIGIPWCDEEYELNNIGLDDLIRALYIGYEVEPQFKAGDWVISKDGEMILLKKWIVHHDGNGNWGGKVWHNPPKFWNNIAIKNEEIIRLATDEEIQQEKQRRWWEKHDREVWELKINDEVINKTLNERFDVVHIFENGDINIESVNENAYGQKGVITVNEATVNNHHYKVICFAEDRKDIKENE